jgi:hypothetical protein
LKSSGPNPISRSSAIPPHRPMKPATLWQFVMEKTGSGESWTWRRTAADGSVEAAATESHENYGDVVYDAIRHGFHPKQEQWIVTDGASSSHYFPDGRAPAIGGARQSQAPMPGGDGER